MYKSCFDWLLSVGAVQIQTPYISLPSSPVTYPTRLSG